MNSVIAIDLGASSGRVMVGHLDSGITRQDCASPSQRILLEEYHRFSNQQVMVEGQSCWDLYRILEEIDVGINKVLSAGICVESLAIDSWGVDFVLLDSFGNHLGEFVSYRDSRTEGMLSELLDDTALSREEIYDITGIQFLSFNTLYQLKALAQKRPAWFDSIHTLLFIPDYLNYKLCGVMHCEYTNASTSQLLECQSKTWSLPLIQACGAKPNWFLPLGMPNQIIGQYQRHGVTIPVCSVASHDTASAVAAAPITAGESAYLSSGTWSLLGVESFTPCTNDLARRYNITNEGGVDGRYRILKNIMGLWLLQRLKVENPSLSFEDFALLAKSAEPFQYLINPNDELFLNPSSMTEAIKQWFAERSMTAPNSFAQLVRCVYDSLALAYCQALEQISEATQIHVDSIRIVGGGTQDKLLNQLCADVCQLTVFTAPTEASALGNVLNQMIALGHIDNLEQGRDVISRSSQVGTFRPQPISDLDMIKRRYQTLSSS